MDIASLSISNSMAQTQQTASILMLKKSMDMAQETNNNMLKMIDAAAPTLAPGKHIDIRI